MLRAFRHAVLLVLLTPGLSSAATTTIELTVSAGKYARKNEPVCVPLALPYPLKIVHRIEVKDAKGKRLAEGQLSDPGLLTEGVKASPGKYRKDLHFILPALAAGTTAHFKAVITHDLKRIPKTPDVSRFTWHLDRKSWPNWTEVRLAGRPVFRAMQARYDNSSAARREQTYKVFHHVYDPRGKRLLTKGPGGLYTHHRGLVYGFMKVRYDDTEADIWHCKGDTHQEWEGSSKFDVGPVMGRYKLTVNWNGKGKKTFAVEERELAAYNVRGGTLLEFTSLLRPKDRPVKLDGDPQHAGFHFRADNEVASKTKDQTIFIRPDGTDKPGKTRNWPDHKKHVNLPWLAMSFVLGKQRYTAAYLDRPSNPKAARFSERSYGRFGSYFVREVTKKKPLRVNYRVWVQEGQMKPAEVAALSAAFVHPVAVKVK
jgi:hypothetical protein